MTLRKVMLLATGMIYVCMAAPVPVAEKEQGTQGRTWGKQKQEEAVGSKLQDFPSVEGEFGNWNDEEAGQEGQLKRFDQAGEVTFSVVDKDGNGLISRDEWEAYKAWQDRGGSGEPQAGERAAGQGDAAIKGWNVVGDPDK